MRYKGICFTGVYFSAICFSNVRPWRVRYGLTAGCFSIVRSAISRVIFSEVCFSSKLPCRVWSAGCVSEKLFSMWSKRQLLGRAFRLGTFDWCGADHIIHTPLTKRWTMGSSNASSRTWENQSLKWKCSTCTNGSKHRFSHWWTAMICLNYLISLSLLKFKQVKINLSSLAWKFPGSRHRLAWMCGFEDQVATSPIKNSELLILLFPATPALRFRVTRILNKLLPNNCSHPCLPLFNFKTGSLKLCFNGLSVSALFQYYINSAAILCQFCVNSISIQRQFYVNSRPILIQ